MTHPFRLMVTGEPCSGLLLLQSGLEHVHVLSTVYAHIAGVLQSHPGHDSSAIGTVAAAGLPTAAADSMAS